MKLIAGSIAIAACLCSMGCVRRTITADTIYTNPDARLYNAPRNDQVVDEQTIWFWQGEFWNR